MIGYLSRRLLAMVPTLLGITLITFFVINLAPGDPVGTTFDAGGPGAGEEGAGPNQDRLADAIKAKKQLLGMMAEHHAVLRWPASRQETYRSGVAGRLPAWGRSLASTGGTLVVGGERGAITLLDANGRTTTTFAAHDGPVWALAARADRIVSADKRGQVVVQDFAGAQLGTRPGDGKPLRKMVFAGDRLFAASDAGWVAELDPASGAQVRTAEPRGGAVYALAAHRGRLYTGGVDRELITLDLDTLEAVHRLEGHGGAINDIVVSPDGTRLATASDDRLVRLFELVAGEPRPIAEFEGHYKQVTAVAFSADGQTLFSGSRDELVRSYDVGAAKPVGVAAQTTGRVHDLIPTEDGALAVGAFWRKVPVWNRYATWLTRIVTLDFGRSFVDDELVMDKISRALPITIGLNLLAILIIYGISVPLGVAAALRRGEAFDNVSSLVVFVLYSVPNFWLATMLIMMFSSSRFLDIFPSGKLQVEQPWDLSYLAWLADIGWHLVLPVTVMVYAGFASLSRYVRTSMLEALSQDFVRTARAKGLLEGTVIIGHALRNALITIITLVGNLLPRMIGGSVIVEYIFSIDGMGRLSFDAILSRDYPVIMAITTFAAVLTLLGILVSDLLYGAADPRARVHE